MRRAPAVTFLAAALAAALCPASAEMSDPPRRSSALPRPRDGNVAIRQELEAARRAGTVEAYDLFLARHPDHPLAAVAREEQRALKERRR